VLSGSTPAMALGVTDRMRMTGVSLAPLVLKPMRQRVLMRAR